MKKLNDAKERNKEIVVMVNTANELKTIVEEASNMVIYQGIFLIELFIILIKVDII